MIIGVISLFVVLFLATIVAIPFSSMLVALRARMCGRYFNRYFTVSRKKNGDYELHHQPAFGFYYANERKFYRFMMDAIQKFQQAFPDATLIAYSNTFNKGNRKGTPVAQNRFMLALSRFMADVLIVCNLANYRMVDGQWRFAKLSRNVHQTTPMRYVLSGGAV